MSELAARFERLRSQIESAAFMVVKGGGEQQVHSELLRALIGLSELERLCLTREPGSVNPDQYADEIAKVRNRLRLWAQPDRQHQINARILNAFLKLERAGAVITEEVLRSELPDVESFESNFVQMKIIAEKNHGKVFDQVGPVIKIWEPVLPYVRAYEEATGDGTGQLESHTIVSVVIVDGNKLKPNWKSPMQMITTDKGKYIDNMPGRQFGFLTGAKPGFNWEPTIGKSVAGIKVFNYAGYKWLNKQ